MQDQTGRTTNRQGREGIVFGALTTGDGKAMASGVKKEPRRKICREKKIPNTREQARGRSLGRN